MEIELEARVKALGYKVKAMSRESPSQKASHVLDADLRTHWSTATNTKEWILLELNEPCLLSHIRIYNKSVLEWEISVGLRFKPETFVKVRPRCEAPRRDMVYPMNYTPCRYVRISCLRGNPIAIFFIQLIGVSVIGLEPEFQPVVNHLLPHIIAHKQDIHDMHLQLLKDLTNRLTVFLPQLEADLSSFSDAVEPNLRFLAMLAGPFYPLLHAVYERATTKSSGNISDSEISKNCQQSSALTVSSNFEPRRSRTTSPFFLSTSSSVVFRQDFIFMLLRKAYNDSDLGTVCRMASRILHKFIEPVAVLEASVSPSEVTSGDESSRAELINPFTLVDYSNMFGEEFQLPDDQWDSNYLNTLDLGVVEEGILHVLYACASQPILCSKLAGRTSDFWSALPLVQALLPALRPSVISPSDIVDDCFSQWKQPVVQQALSQIVAMSSSSLYRPLLRACAGYLASFSPSHAKAACVLVDLCCSVLDPWMTQVIAKVDLAVELLEDLLGTIQAARHSLPRARAALKYIVLAISGHMDDILGKYKEVKHRILFLVEMLEPFLDPAIASFKSTIAFGDLSSAYPEKQENNCAIALNVVRTAVRKPEVLPSLECEWRRGSVAPSVLLSILEPHIQLPPEIDLRISPISKSLELESTGLSSAPRGGVASSKSNGQDELDGKVDVADTAAKMDVFDDASLLFAPAELRSIALTNNSNDSNESSSVSSEPKLEAEKFFLNQFHIDLELDAGFTAEYFNLQADYFQLINYQDCKLRASEFRHLAQDLHLQNEIMVEGHDAAIDALLLAAECYVNPFFMMSFVTKSKFRNQINLSEIKTPKIHEKLELRRVSGKYESDLEKIALVEKKRDKIVLQILLEAAELDRKYQEKVSGSECCSYDAGELDEEVVKLSSLDMQSTDAITLVRQNQALLCNFLIQRLQREQHSMHEILIQSLVFLLHSATKLYCAPEQVIDIILQSAEYLNGMLSSLYHQFKEGLHLKPETVYGIQRRWILLQRLVIASSNGDEGADFAISKNNGFRYQNLIPPSAWMQRISTFSRSASPLVRFLGWMAVSRNAKQYIKDRLFLASDLRQLTYLLSIFGDELAAVDNVINQKHEEKHAFSFSEVSEADGQQHENQCFHIIYPDLSKFFPNMKKQFEAFGEIILEAVSLQLRSLSSSVIPDILCWFSELCSWPFYSMEQLATQNNSYSLKGYAAKNAKAIILYVLEAIITEHMEAMVPEIPRVLQVLVSLCRTSYCDVSFLDSVMQLLEPIISYSLCKVSDEERLLLDDSCLDFESLCFGELFTNIRSDENQDDSTKSVENQNGSNKKVYSRGLTIFILASVFPYLSFQRRREMLRSLILWADFTAFEPTTNFHDYLCAFQSVMGSCKLLLVQNLQLFGAIPLEVPSGRQCDSSFEAHLWFLRDVCHNSSPDKFSEKLEGNNIAAVIVNKNVHHLSTEDIEEFRKDLEVLIEKLNPTVELCWNLHHQLAKKLIISSAECFMYSRCLSSVAQKTDYIQDNDNEASCTSKSVDQFLVHWMVGLEGIAETILALQEKSCWEVASVMLDCLLAVPHCFSLDNVLGFICSAVKNNFCSAPKLAWRLQTDKWLSVLLARGIHSLGESEASLVDLFCTLLGHPEPEQRFIALKLLGKLVGQDLDNGTALQDFDFCSNLFTPALSLPVPESVISHLVSSTWDRVVLLASSDKSLLLRTRAMALLVDYIPFAHRHLLQSLLATADNLHGLGKLAQPTCEGPLLRLSLALIAGASLYCPSEDLSLLPQNVWRNIETLALSKTENKIGDIEKRACQILCRLKNEGDEAKEVLKEVLSASSSKQFYPDFGSTREAVLQVLANLTSVKSYFDIFSNKVDKEVMELEEAEIELDILRKEYTPKESLKDSKEECQIPSLDSTVKHETRLQQIKECINTLEKSKLREDIAARRQKKLLMRHAREKYLEEVAVRDAELVQELDRERASETEKEIERLRLLELERSKTRELRHNLDMEKERQAQRELQRELEQAESGRPSRREFSSSTHSGRTRERYRERENGRSGTEGSTRTSSGNLQPETSTSSLVAMPTVVLSGSRPFSGQLPTILQSHERLDECGSSYEENMDGSKDSGDTGSIGDPDLASAFDGQPGGFGSVQRHGSRGSKSRQVVERRERDGRREGKWERKGNIHN